MNDLDELLATQRVEHMVPQRPRSARATANDQLLRSALQDLSVQRSWDAVTMAGLASHAGFSPTVVRARAHSVAELGKDLRQHEVGQVSTDTATATLDALHGDGIEILKALHRWTQPSPPPPDMRWTWAPLTGPHFGYMLLACLLDGLDELPLLGPISNGLRNYHDHI